MNPFPNTIELDITDDLEELSEEGAVEYGLQKLFGDKLDDYVALKYETRDDSRANKEGRVRIAIVGYSLL